MGFFLLIWSLILMAPYVSGTKVCIIGAGIGGAATAFFLAKQPSAVEVVVVERSARVGGRLKSISFQGSRINLGGDAWAAVNENMMELQRVLQIPLDTSDYAGNGQSAVWNGSAFFPTSKFEPITDLEMAAEIELLRLRLEENYRHLSSFSSIEEYVAAGLKSYVMESASRFAQRLRINPYFQQILWEPLTRTIYDQSLNMTLFSAMVALISTERAYSAAGGNDRFVEALLNASGATVLLNRQVSSISQAGDLVDANGNFILGACNFVVLAAPLEMAGLANVANETLPPHRFYHHWWVTLVAADGLNPAYFGLSNSSQVPDSILTTQSASLTTPWTMCSVMAKGLGAAKIYKCFSNEDVSSEIPQLFLGVSETFVQYWPQTFPQLVPGVDSFQPIQLTSAASGSIPVLYLNTMESVAVAMEGSVIAGKNAAKLIKSRIH